MGSAILALTAGGAVSDVGRSLREGFFMFWETLWPLVLGFGLSGAVQAFVSRAQMERVLGDHRPRTVVRASALGMVSSSCSYAASAMSKSLFEKGADFVTSMVFMFASTNLVVELGIVLAILMGWQFTAAEFVGGPIMIVLLATLGGFVLTPRLVGEARRRLAAGRTGRDHGHDLDQDHEHGSKSANRGDCHAGSGADTESAVDPADRKKVLSVGAWSDAASYTIADLTMLRKEMVAGYAIAGFLAVLVPDSVWNAVFVNGHGAWTYIENAVVGPVIAFVSFVCSIGNVPMAAALWKGGISFGGVVSFIFADLIAAPLVLIYRRYYGGRVTLRLVGLFWAVMAGSGLAVEAIFSFAGLVPSHRSRQIAPTAFHFNYTSVLNVIFVLLFLVLYWMYRNRERLGGGSGYALDPVCGMQVRTANAPARRDHRGTRFWFCSDRCAGSFDADPEKFAGTGKERSA